MLINNQRALATIQKITNIQPIENADKIERAEILGWQCVIKKDTFKIGDLAIYIEIDSIVPDIPYFEFMRERKFRVCTIKLRQTISQGLIVKITDLLPDKNYKEGQDVTELLKIKKYDPEKLNEEKQINNKKLKNPILRFLYRFAFFRFFLKPTARKFPFPSHIIPKTDEERIQNMPYLLDKIKDKELYITEKLDGSSATYILYKNKFYVCSRNMNLPKDNSVWWKIAIDFEIEKKLKNLKDIYKKEFAIQGEIIGEKIQDNKYGLTGIDFYLFNIYDIKTKRYLDYQDLFSISEIMNIKTVPILHDSYYINTDVNGLVEMSKAKSVLSDIWREGIVIRNKDLYKNKISFKVINPEFLLKYDL